MSKIFKFSVRHGIFLHWKRVLFCFVLLGNWTGIRKHVFISSGACGDELLVLQILCHSFKDQFVNELLLCLDPAARQNT